MNQNVIKEVYYTVEALIEQNTTRIQSELNLCKKQRENKLVSLMEKLST